MSQLRHPYLDVYGLVLVHSFSRSAEIKLGGMETRQLCPRGRGVEAQIYADKNLKDEERFGYTSDFEVHELQNSERFNELVASANLCPNR